MLPGMLPHLQGLFAGPQSLPGMCIPHGYNVPGFQPVTGEMGSLPGAQIPHGYLGPDARPCGGYGGYDAAVNETRRLQEAAWNSIPTHNIHEPSVGITNNIHEPHRPFNNSATMPDLPKRIERDPLYFMPQIPKMPEIPSMPTIRPMPEIGFKPAMAEMYPQPKYNPLESLREQCQRRQEESNRRIADICKSMEVAPIVRQRDPLTVFVQSGYSHFSYVDPLSLKTKKPGWHETTQIPGLGADVGLDKGFSIHTYIKTNRKGHLTFDTDF